MKFLISLCGALATLTAFQVRSADLLKKVADIPLPGTRFDYASIDAAAGRLYFSHMLLPQSNEVC